MKQQVNLPTTRARFTSYGLRTLLIAITLIALAIGYCSSHARKQCRITEELVALGANIKYRYQYDDFEDEEEYSYNHENRQPWLAHFIGIDYCSAVVSVSSFRAEDSARVAKLSSELPSLRLLVIQDAEIHPEDVEQFTRMRNLRGLYLANTSLDDASVPGLSRLTWLQVLNVNNTGLTTKGAKALSAALLNTRVHAQQGVPQRVTSAPAR